MSYLFKKVAEADGNRTRQAENLGLVGFEDRGGHQAPRHLRARTYQQPRKAKTFPPAGRDGHARRADRPGKC
jgi:hypothetical protein